MAVTTTVEADVAVIALDDTKMNAITPGVIEGIAAGLDVAAADAKAVCIVGNDRALSAGFDLSVMQGGDAAAVGSLLDAGARLLMRLFVHPQPTIVAVTGHALAAGALVVLACDTRIGTGTKAKIGLNETAIGLPLPQFAWELAAARLAPSHLTRAAVQAEIFDPAGAVVAGYLDEVSDDCVTVAKERAAALAALPTNAYAATKRSLRQPVVDRVLAGL